ncbi:hypothetical protein [Pseudomonas bharatica]|uniref:hypothetical protein n=1 Tax=Pseudomonas bharatica TaxID=2692112 RepID=UPI001F044E06|nr:hypothetical protein [Pseudomonas bharatica]
MLAYLRQQCSGRANHNSSNARRTHNKNCRTSKEHCMSRRLPLYLAALCALPASQLVSAGEQEEGFVEGSSLSVLTANSTSTAIIAMARRQPMQSR